MGKFRKKLKKQVNPEKSNKMIIAIGIGTMTLFIVFFILLMNPSTPANKLETINKTLEYLKKDDGILSIKPYPEKNRAIVIFDSFKQNRDYVGIVRYAAIRLSNELGPTEFTVVLSKDKEDQEAYVYVLKSGDLIREIKKLDIPYNKNKE